MTSTSLTTRWLVPALAVIVLTCSTAPLQALTDEEVGKAIDRLKQTLLQTHVKGGGWEPNQPTGGQDGGQTALATYALLVSGESFQRQEVAEALDWMWDPKQAEWFGTYAVSLRAHCWAQLPESPFLSRLETDVKWLFTKGGQTGTWGYTGGAGDHSVSQYGLLGLWEGSKRGIHIAPERWAVIIKHFISTQHVDGGWTYSGVGPSYGSMAAAGLTALLVAQQELYRKLKTPEPNITLAINKGVDWFDKNFKGLQNPPASGFPHYYIYGVERVGIATGIRDFNNQDWYQAAATEIVRNPPGGLVDASFALLFLSRGRYPVWISKIKLKGQNWNNRPNDLYFITQYLSDVREVEINFQTVDLEEAPENLLKVPIAYISTDKAIELTPKQTENLKRYIDLGGMLVINPEEGSAAIVESVRKLAGALYPQWPMKPLMHDHPLFTSLNQIGDRSSVQAVNNGVRDLIIVASRDWGYEWQATEPQRGTSFEMATNLFVYASDRGTYQNRLVHAYTPRTGQPSGELVIARPRYKGNWLPEATAWEQVANMVANAGGPEVKVSATEKIENKVALRALATAQKKAEAAAKAAQEAKAAADAKVAEAAEGQVVPVAPGERPEAPPIGTELVEVEPIIDLDKLGECDLPLVHLTGVDRLDLTSTQLDAIDAYAKRGGTVLVETVGGRGAFTQNIERQLNEHLKRAATPLPPDHAIVTGTGLKGGHDARHVSYRRFAVLAMALVDKAPRLAAFMYDDRPAIIISNEDLSEGMLGNRRFDTIGYTPDSARKLMMNLVLWANDHKPAPAGAAAAVPAEAPAEVPVEAPAEAPAAP